MFGYRYTVPEFEPFFNRQSDSEHPTHKFGNGLKAYFPYDMILQCTKFSREEIDITFYHYTETK
jgi:hypothetical protein